MAGTPLGPSCVMITFWHFVAELNKQNHAHHNLDDLTAEAVGALPSVDRPVIALGPPLNGVHSDSSWGFDAACRELSARGRLARCSVLSSYKFQVSYTPASCTKWSESGYSQELILTRSKISPCQE